MRRFDCHCDDPDSCERDCAYGRIFDPPRDANAPSGLQDPPRPFVLRPKSVDSFAIHVFDVHGGTAQTIVKSLKPASSTVREISVDLSPRVVAAKRLQLEFLTPTDLRSDVPAFATVFARARDRVSTLRAVYGSGPLSIDHRALGDLAKSVTLLSCDLNPQVIARRSGTTGQVHTIGGFTGSATYEGDFSLLYPILEAAQFTGIGRKTVWGNGQFSMQVIG